jgi:long-chain acyl-CoA synthetase
MDVSRYLDLKPAPRAVFDNLPERATRARFFVPQGDGDWKAVTWAAHAKQIRHAALFLRSSGFKAGERGAVFAPNSVEWMSAALAIQTAGGVIRAPQHFIEHTRQV